MIDSHCHLDLPEFDNHRHKLIDECVSHGISRILVPGLYLNQLQDLIKFKQTHSYHSSEQRSLEIDIAYGLHPYFLYSLDEHEQHKLIDQVSALANQHCKDIVAIGECGLDASLALDIDFQTTMLKAQVRLAENLSKPLILHHRKTHHILLQVLKEENYSQGGLVHAFSGSEQVAQQYLDFGFSLGIGGTITYPRAAKTRHTVTNIPLEYLLLETDAPDMPLIGYQGQANSPLMVKNVAQCLSELKQVDISLVEKTTDSNYAKLFL